MFVTLVNKNVITTYLSFASVVVASLEAILTTSGS